VKETIKVNHVWLSFVLKSKKDSLEIFFAELTGDNPKKPEDNEVIQAIIQESESLIPRRNGKDLS